MLDWWNVEPIIRDGARCRCCGDFKLLEQHYILDRAWGQKKGIPPTEIEHPDNGITLCQRCHSITYGRKKRAYLEAGNNEIQQRLKKMMAAQLLATGFLEHIRKYNEKAAEAVKKRCLKLLSADALGA